MLNVKCYLYQTFFYKWLIFILNGYDEVCIENRIDDLSLQRTLEQ